MLQIAVCRVRPLSLHGSQQNGTIPGPRTSQAIRPQEHHALGEFFFCEYFTATTSSGGVISARFRILPGPDSLSSCT
jgi:hypothetical protein